MNKVVFPMIGKNLSKNLMWLFDSLSGWEFGSSYLMGHSLFGFRGSYFHKPIEFDYFHEWSDFSVIFSTSKYHIMKFILNTKYKYDLPQTKHSLCQLLPKACFSSAK